MESAAKWETAARFTCNFHLKRFLPGVHLDQLNAVENLSHCMNMFVFYYHCFCLEYICEICQDTRKEEEKMISPLIAKIPKVEGKGIPQ